MNKTSSKQLREIITSLRNECIDLLPEEFQERVAEASKAYFDHRKTLNAELQRLKGVERRASNLDKALAEQRKQYDEQKERVQSLERKSSSAEKALAASAKDHEDSLNSLKATMLATTAKAIVPHLALIGDLYAQTQRWNGDYTATAEAVDHISDEPALQHVLRNLVLASVAGYYLQGGTTHLISLEGMVISVEQYDTSDDFSVTVMMPEEAAELYDLKE